MREIAEFVLIICVSLSTVITITGIFADQICKIIREIRRRY